MHQSNQGWCGKVSTPNWWEQSYPIPSSWIKEGLAIRHSISATSLIKAEQNELQIKRGKKRNIKYERPTCSPIFLVQVTVLKLQR